MYGVVCVAWCMLPLQGKGDHSFGMPWPTVLVVTEGCGSTVTHCCRTLSSAGVQISMLASGPCAHSTEGQVGDAFDSKGLLLSLPAGRTGSKRPNEWGWFAYCMVAALGLLQSHCLLPRRQRSHRQPNV